MISLDAYQRFFVQQLDAFILVKLQPGADVATTQTAIEASVKDFANIQVHDQATFRQQQEGFIDQLLGLVTALLAMAILIALFGIVNTLASRSTSGRVSSVCSAPWA